MLAQLFACDQRFPEGRPGATYWKGAQVLEPIVVWRVKDRMATRTNGGWADAMINFSFFADGNVHICEIQLAHQRLLTDRKEGGAHRGYAIYRAANEILCRIGKLPESELQTEDEPMEAASTAVSSQAPMDAIMKAVEQLQKQVAAMGQAQTELQLQNAALKSEVVALKHHKAYGSSPKTAAAAAPARKSGSSPQLGRTQSDVDLLLSQNSEMAAGRR
jgi:flagellin-like hook-associated protein FlgL